MEIGEALEFKRSGLSICKATVGRALASASGILKPGLYHSLLSCEFWEEILNISLPHFVICKVRKIIQKLLSEVNEILYVKELGNYKTPHKGEVFGRIKVTFWFIQELKVNALRYCTKV